MMYREIPMRKKEMRARIKTRLSTLSPSEKAIQAERMEQKLFSSKEWKRSRRVFCFLSMKREIQTRGIITRALNEGKMLALPRMDGEDIRFLLVKSLDPFFFDAHPYGVFEPKKELPEALPTDPDRDLLVLPGAAFQRSGERLGWGKGFYDRFLSRHSSHCRSIGICFDLQLVDKIPTDEHDIAVERVISGGELF